MFKINYNKNLILEFITQILIVQTNRISYNLDKKI